MGTILVSTVSGSGQPNCGSGADVVSQVAACVGGVDENNVRAQALDCVNRARQEVDMHDWRFLKRTVVSTSFVAAQTTYTLPTTFKSPSFFKMLDTSGKQFRDLQYVDDASFTHWLAQQTQTGPPSLYSLRNTFNDGLISFYPVPDASTVSGYTWAGEYYTRIATIADSGTSMLTDVPEEICNVIIAGGQYFLVSEREKGNANLINHKWQDYQRVKNLALVNDRRMTDDSPRFRLPARRQRYPANSLDWYGWPW